MGIFKKNPNESAFTGGKKHFVDVIKNSGSGDMLIWRQPEEDFNYNSTLIVMPGESAIFIKNGRIQYVFDAPGRYKLDSQNYPFLSRLTNSFSGGISSYNSVVYFLRSVTSQEIRWGTRTPIDVRDKIWGVVTQVRARGSYKVRINNPGLFLMKLLGNNVQYETPEGLDDYFTNEFQSKIRSIISQNLNDMENEIIGIEAYMEDISRQIAPKIREVLAAYGLECMNFNIAAMDVDKEKYQQFDESQISMYQKKMEAMGYASQMQILGDDWDKIQRYDILKEMVSNPNPSAGLGMGMVGAEIGVGAAAGSMLGQMAKQAFNTDSNINTNTNSDSEDPIKALAQLKKMYEMGLIEKSEYDGKRAEILERL